jgi:catechol 2,3-dioxygenase-like lactoylglutathione lyase family enzyme
MIGYETEDKAYAMEVTYNYGVESYKMGTGLAAFTIAVDDSAKAAKAAGELGYLVRNNNKGTYMIIGPDSYRFAVVVKATTPRAEPFLSVRLHVSDVEAATKFYTDVLRMTVVAPYSTGTAADEALDESDVALAYANDQVAALVGRESSLARVLGHVLLAPPCCERPSASQPPPMLPFEVVVAPLHVGAPGRAYPAQDEDRVAVHRAVRGPPRHQHARRDPESGVRQDR